MKKQLFKLAAVVCLTLCLAVSAEAASVVDSGSCGADDGANLTWTLYSDGRLTISGSGMMTDNPEWTAYADEIRSVAIDSRATTIGDYAFFGCAALTSLTIPNNVTRIGDYAFFGCAALASLTIPNNVTEIGDYALSGCAALTSLKLPNSVTDIGACAFSECAALKTITLGSGAAIIGSAAFDGCASLTAITVNSANPSFRDVNGVLLSAAGDVLYAYPAGKPETAYVIPTGVREVEDYAFAGCRALTMVMLRDGVTAIGAGAFMNCAGLASAAIPDSVTSIGYDAFHGCTSLTNVVIPSDVTEIGFGAFSGCTSLTAITVSGGSFDFRDVEGVLYSADGNVLYAYPAGRETPFYHVPYGVTVIGAGAFKDCEHLTEAAFSDSVSTIGEYAFAGCAALTELVIPSSVTGIGEYAFQDCMALQDAYYAGTEDDWEYCVNEMGNECLLDAVHYIDSETLNVMKLGFDEGFARATVYTPFSAAAYLALYDGDGRFLGVEARLLRDGELGTLTISSPDAASAKLVLLDESGVPLCASGEA